MTLAHAWQTRRTPGRDVPYAITDSAEAVWTVTPPEAASEVDTKFPRSQTAGEGETPTHPPGEGALGREGG